MSETAERPSILDRDFYYRPLGIFITPEELEKLQSIDRANRHFLRRKFDVGEYIDVLIDQYHLSEETGLCSDTGQFWQPIDAPLITWFDASPDVGKDCLCSMCGQPILQEHIEGVVLLRYWNDRSQEARLHDKCRDLVLGRRPA